MQSETQIVKPTAEQLAAILADHKLWILGRGGKRADLRSANLRSANLSYADLSSADLSSANLSSADLRYANLRSANLSYADLRYANLSYANLSSANLSSANLSSADLRYADLSSANLRYANLRYANLSYANLSYADLSSANLRYADLSSANLRYANLSYANLSYANLRYADLSSANLRYANLQESKEAGLVLARTEIVPREGEVIGWKQCRGGVLVKLRVPPDSPRSNGLGRKCRAGRVEVLEVVGAEVGVSLHDGVTEYRAGATVTPSGWDANRLNECAPGVHFYLTREEAEAHS